MSNLLLEPFKIKNLELENRIMRSATWDATADEQGRVTERSVALYQGLARGKIGLIVSGYAFVSSHGQAVVGQYGVHNDDTIPGLKKMTETVHQEGGKIALQIVHAGINSGYLSKKGIAPLAVSRIPELKYEHREMTGEEIELIIDDFVAGALRGREAGFDAIQLHGAHGYLMSQFISPLYNRRTDRWGGSPENRRRFHLEIVSRIRKALGDDFPLHIKFGIMDDDEGGLTLEEGIEAAQLMVQSGIDAIEVSAGAGKSVRAAGKDTSEQLYFRERSAVARKVISVPVMLVGGLRQLETARDIVDSGDADMVSMCRPFIREPELAARWQAGNGSPATCISCNRCLGIVARAEPLECGEDRRLREEAASACNK